MVCRWRTWSPVSSGTDHTLIAETRVRLGDREWWENGRVSAEARQRRLPRVVAGLLVVIGCLLAVVALAGAYSRLILLDPDRFADRATLALEEKPVRDEIANELADQLVLNVDQDLVAFRPVIVAAIGEAVGSSPFRSLFRAAVRDVHRTAFSGEADTATLFLGDVGILTEAILQARFPNADSARIPGKFAAELRVDSSNWPSNSWYEIASGLSRAAGLAAALCLLCLVAAVYISADRRRAMINSALSLALAGGLILVATQVLRSEVVGNFQGDERAVAAAVWDSFAGDLATWAFVLIGVSLIVAAAFASLLRPIGIRNYMIDLGRQLIRQPESDWTKVLRAVLLCAAGILILLEPGFFLRATAVIFGSMVLFTGLEELTRIISGPVPEPVDEPVEDRSRRRGRFLLAIGCVAGLLVLAGGGAAVSGSFDLSKAQDGLCNGGELCDRGLEEVVFPTTHNSMAAATTPGWNFPQQETEVGTQLDDGVRGLMLDAYYGRVVGNRVRTDIDDSQFRRSLEGELGPAATEAAIRIRDRLVGGNRSPGPREVWLCHGACEVGAIRMSKVLGQIRDFMERNPHEVVMIVVQDEGPQPSSIQSEFESSGLMPYVYEGPVDGELPTLQEMIDSGGRLLVTGENDASDPAVPWYHQAFELMQETPFHFSDRNEFSCRANRGTPDAPLFLLNHWVDTSPTPLPSNAVIVNSNDFLMARAEKCAEVRGMLPNLVAVDFYRRGDLFTVTDAMNVAEAAGSFSSRPADGVSRQP